MGKTNRNISVAIVGCGTVGGATAVLLTRDQELIRQRSGVSLVLKYIVDKDFSRARSLGLDSNLFEKDLERVLADEEVKIVAELVGGTTIAKDITLRALEAGKHVVTANKALLAHAGPELLKKAREKGVTLSFEASCGGGIPIIRALYDGLIANRIDALYGIVNGTCNYILTQMTQRNISYSQALKEAQETGLAEANPFLDVSGMDSAHKLTILASLAFGQWLDLDAIPVTGIDTLKTLDIQYGSELGYIIKLLAVATRLNGKICLRVRPAFISRQHPLAWVSGPFNAISVYGHVTGHTMYYGRGAGGSPTSSAVAADMVSAAIGTQQTFFDTLGLWADRTPRAQQASTDELVSRFYLRFMITDTVGVLAKIAAVLGENYISIASVLQKEMPENRENLSIAPVVIITHKAKEKNIRKALEGIRHLDVVREEPVCIHIMDEHEESL
ncbi:MAG: homoserine dehydrogenase [Spirochaetales bacterium]|nr:homoserine dehydrogenase [Spirochaetales bacterium]